jgi:hypothetical protein
MDFYAQVPCGENGMDFAPYILMNFLFFIQNSSLNIQNYKSYFNFFIYKINHNEIDDSF